MNEADKAAITEGMQVGDVVLDRLVNALRIGAQEAGEAQSLADVSTLVMKDYPEPMMLLGLLSVAMRRIAFPVDAHSCTVCGAVDQPEYQHRTEEHDSEKE